MTIRDAAEADLPAIVAIYNASVPGRMATCDTEPVTVDERRAWFAKHDPKRRPLWVMETDDGAIAGWLGFSDYVNPRPGYHATAELSVYVAPQQQGRGVGHALCAEAIRRGPELGLRNLVSIVFAHNAPSIALCEKFGFTRWGFLPRVAEMDGVERDVVIMGLRLNE